jgi:glycosyltransferase involved in cell wall biosynthesis
MTVLREMSLRHRDNIDIILFGGDREDPAFGALPQDFVWRHAGILTRNQLAMLLNEVDIFVDLSGWQAMGLTALQAMASGAAVLVPREGGVSAYARHEANALVVDTSSFSDCVETVNRLILDEALRTRLQGQAISDACLYYPEGPAYRLLEALF